jgi:hypothetical protein
VWVLKFEMLGAQTPRGAERHNDQRSYPFRVCVLSAGLPQVRSRPSSRAKRGVCAPGPTATTPGDQRLHHTEASLADESSRPARVNCRVRHCACVTARVGYSALADGGITWQRGPVAITTCDGEFWPASGASCDRSCDALCPSSLHPRCVLRWYFSMTPKRSAELGRVPGLELNLTHPHPVFARRLCQPCDAGAVSPAPAQPTQPRHKFMHNPPRAGP